MASLAWLAHRTWGARDARNALLAHRSSGAHLAIPRRALRTWVGGREESEKEGQETQVTRKEEIVLMVNNTLRVVNTCQVTRGFREDLI